MAKVRVFLAVMFFLPAIAIAQQPKRPSLGAVVPPAAFRDAIENGTRTATGAPGARYWQNTASYKINARLIPETKR